MENLSNGMPVRSQSASSTGKNIYPLNNSAKTFSYYFEHAVEQSDAGVQWSHSKKYQNFSRIFSVET